MTRYRSGSGAAVDEAGRDRPLAGLGRNDILDFDEWMELDLAYIDNWSLGLDLKILVRTIPAVLGEKGRGSRRVFR